MFDTIHKIFQTLTSGFKLYKESNKNLFENFLKPAMTDFETVHENYINSYIKYIVLLSENEKPYDKNHPVFKMIKDDALFSMNIREKIYSFYDYTNDKKFSRFVHTIINYFDYSSNSVRINNVLDYEIEQCCNSYRNETYHGLIYILENEEITNKREQALKQTRLAIKKLQDNYRKVIDSYNELKIELLS